MSEWVSLLQTFGLAVTILIFLGICLWRVGGWTAENVIKPIVARYLQLLDALIVSIVKQGETLSRVGTVMESLSTVMTKIGATMDGLINARPADYRRYRQIDPEEGDDIHTPLR